MGRSYTSFLESARRPALATLVALTLLAGVAPIASAATLTNAWTARIGSAGINGSASINGYLSGTGTIVLRLAKLKPATYLPVTLSKGTCGSVGSTIIKFPSIRTTSSGAAARTASLTAAQVTLVQNATKGTAKIAIRVGSSTVGGIKCGVFAAVAVPSYVAARIAIGHDSNEVAVAPNGVLVANWYDGTLSRVDPDTNAVLSVIPLTITGNEGPWAVTYGEGAVWVAIQTLDTTGSNVIAGSVERLDPVSDAVVATIPVGKGSDDITTSPGAVWVPNLDDGTVSRIDPATNQVSATISISPGVSGVAFGFGSLWVANETTGTVSRIDPATNAIVATISTVGAAEGVVTGAGAVWVANYGTPGQPDGVLSRIDPATNQVVRTVPVGGNPVYLAFGGGFVWAALRSESTVVQVNATTNSVQARISSGILVLGASGKILGLHGIAATDHAVWAVQPQPVDPLYLPFSLGNLVRINY